MKATQLVRLIEEADIDALHPPIQVVIEMVEPNNETLWEVTNLRWDWLHSRLILEMGQCVADRQRGKE